jgi:hypothetical protein
MSAVDATTLLRRVARDAALAQRALDERAVMSWDATGVPPTGVAYTRLAFATPVRVSATACGRLRLAPDRRAAGHVTLALRRVTP